MFKRFEGFGAVYSLVRADAFKHSETIVERLAEQVGFGIFGFDEFAIEKKYCVVVVIHITVETIVSLL